MSVHVARRSRMDQAMTQSAHATPRSTSWTRPKPVRTILSARPPRSSSASRFKKEDTKDEDDAEQRKAMADAAFHEWLARKRREPRGPRASPTREQLELHMKQDKRQRVLNQWLARCPSATKSPTTNGS